MLIKQHILLLLLLLSTEMIKVAQNQKTSRTPNNNRLTISICNLFLQDMVIKADVCTLGTQHSDHFQLIIYQSAKHR